MRERESQLLLLLVQLADRLGALAQHGGKGREGVVASVLVSCAAGCDAVAVWTELLGPKVHCKVHWSLVTGAKSS